MLLTGLDWKYFNWHQMEFHGKLNLLKTGLVFADSINTVSPRYAQEIQSARWAAAWKASCSSGATCSRASSTASTRSDWNPATDPHLAANYDAETVGRASRRARRRCRKSWGCRSDRDVPLVGLVGRLCDQKGFDLVAEVMQHWVQTSDVQWAILGTGEPKYHKLLRVAGRAVPQEASRCGWSSPTRWPTGSRPAPTCSSCPAASSRAG